MGPHRVTAISRVSLAICLAASVMSCARPPASTRPNILLVTIDTWRADRLSAAAAPRLDELARQGLRFTAARAVVPLTLPSHATIMTGELPTLTGVRENGAAVLGDDHATIARQLKAAGYRTAAFVGAFVLDRRFGLAQGFDTYDDRIPRSATATERLEAERPASAVVDSALSWLERSTPTIEDGVDVAPFFMWVHLYDPHAPYAPPPSFIKGNGRSSAAELYDGEVSYTDSQIARIFDALRDRHLAGRTLIVVAGDHGEGLDEHGERTHGMLLYDSTLRVPLIIAGPGIVAGRRDEPVSLVDIAPTILGAAGLNTASGSVSGGNLLVATGSKVSSEPNRGRDIYAETDYPRVAGWSALRALTDGRWKAIRAGSTTELYDVQNDEHEQHDLAGSQSALTSAMRSRLDRIHAAGRQTTQPAVSAEAQERLRALGYVTSATAASESNRDPNPATMTQAWTTFEEALTALNERRSTALPALASLAAAYPDARVFQATYARALKDAGRTRDSLTIYRRSAKRWPTDASLLHDLAVAARETAAQTGRTEAAMLIDEAVNAERAAIALQPNSAIAHNGLGLLAVDAQRPADAAHEFEQAAALDPGNASYWTNLGNARRALGDAASAEAAYKRALDADPNAADAANGVGVLLVEARQPAEAARWFEQALNATPDFVEARLNLGIALQQSGENGRAADAFRSVIAAAGEHPREKDAARKLLASLGTQR